MLGTKWDRCLAHDERRRTVLQDVSCARLDQMNWVLTLLQSDSYRTYRSSSGARLGVHALRGRGDRRNRFGVIEHVAHALIGWGKTQHTVGEVVRRYLTGGEWR